jgi:hypothetical protein
MVKKLIYLIDIDKKETLRSIESIENYKCYEYFFTGRATEVDDRNMIVMKEYDAL